MCEFINMANKGKIYLIGDGNNKINPIHGADLAEVCVNAVKNSQKEIPIGGPKTYTYKEAAELAFSILNKPPRIKNISPKLIKPFIKMIRPFSKHYYILAGFLISLMLYDFNTTKTGSRTLEDFYKEFSKHLMHDKKKEMLTKK